MIPLYSDPHEVNTKYPIFFTIKLKLSIGRKNEKLCGRNSTEKDYYFQITVEETYQTLYIRGVPLLHDKEFHQLMFEHKRLKLFRRKPTKLSISL